jgi:hypothetical protein
MTEHVKRAKRILRETGIGSDRLDIVSEEEEFSIYRSRLKASGVNPLRKGKKVKI